jgi:hypothetical protein
MKSIGNLAFIYFVAAGTAVAAGPTVITFDDLPSPGAGSMVVPNGYAGLQWDNFRYLDPVLQGIQNSGYYHGMISAPQVAYNSFGDPATISGGSFNLLSAYLTGGWNDGLQVEVQGFAGGTQIYDNTYTVNSTAPSLINFEYLGIDSVRFSSFGGLGHAGYVGAGEQFALDMMTIEVIPEPSGFALTGVAAALLVICLRGVGCRRNRRSPPSVEDRTIHVPHDLLQTGSEQKP